VKGLQAWWGEYESVDEADRLPSVGLNARKRAVDVLGVHWPAGHVLVHPLDEAVVIAWRSPMTGNITARGRAWLASPDCGNGVRWSLRDGAAVVRSGEINGSDRARWKVKLLHVKKGDKLYLVVDPIDGDFVCDSTVVSLTIKSRGRRVS
jgi:hypothetical protein